MNKIARAIEKTRENLAKLPQAKVDAVDKTLALDFDEHFEYQQTQAQAHASGYLTTDEAQIIYIALGEIGSEKNGGWAAGTDTATKYAVTLMMQHLLERKLAGTR